MFTHLIAAVWVVAGGTVAGAVVAVVKRYGAVLIQQEAKIRNAGLRDALTFATQEAENAASTVVTSLNQSVTGPLKAAGKWDATAAAAVKQQAITLLNGTLSTDAKAVLSKAMSDLPGFLSTLVESQVATAQNKVTNTPVPLKADTSQIAQAVAAQLKAPQLASLRGAFDPAPDAAVPAPVATAPEPTPAPAVPVAAPAASA